MSEVAVRALVAYTQALQANPLRTKMYTSGALSAMSEVLAGKLAGVPATQDVGSAASKDGGEKRIRSASQQQDPLRLLKLIVVDTLGVNKRAAQMAAYGFLISAPLGHVLTGVLQRAFAGKTSTRDRIAQIVTANLTTAVISNSVYLFCMAYINGARSLDRIVAAWRANIGFLMRVTWITSPISIGVAQRFLPMQLWEPYFNVIRFILGTVFNTITKKKQAALQRQQSKKSKGGNSAQQ